MAESLVFYKLVSPYGSEDYTANCRLTINQIDNNFLTLKDYDIKSAELDEEKKVIILTRNNGDKLAVDISPVLSGAVYDLEVVYENPSEKDKESSKGASVYVKYNILNDEDVKESVTVPIEGLVTTNNINTVLGDGLLTRVISDDSLHGKGTIKSPLGLSPTEKDRPAIRLIDKTGDNPEELPKLPKRGDRYITKEYVSDFGFLYSYYAAKKLQDKLISKGSEWRIPTKEDWDCMLSSVEPCGYCDEEPILCHEDTVCHKELGKYAGMKLKSECGWYPYNIDCGCKNTVPYSGQTCSGTTGETLTDEDIDINEEDFNECGGVDEYGMRILPTGYGDEFGKVNYENKITKFWTSTHVCNDSQDLYVKRFDWDACGVIQEAICPSERNSIRLVKTFDGDNYFETELIDGNNYNTILFPQCSLIWTATNFANNDPEYNPIESSYIGSEHKRIVHYINVWDGNDWIRRALTQGESVVITEGNESCQYNIEYRVYMADECNQELVNVDDTVVTRVLDRVVPLIEEERDERIEGDAILSGAIETEREEREEADIELNNKIEAEVDRATEVEQQLWEAINDESVAREEADQQIWEALNNETSARTEADEILNEKIDSEIERATSAETALDEKIDAEIERATSAETALDEKIDSEIERATSAETVLNEKIDAETERAIGAEIELDEKIGSEIERAISAETALDEKIDAEIERAKDREDEIDGQLIDVSEGPYILSMSPENEDEPNLVLKSKDGNEDHFINIKIRADFGTF